MKKFKTPKPTASGWTRWQQPKHDGYLMQCCKCGLVHEMKFAVVRFASDTSSTAEFIDDKNVRVAFKVKRCEA